MDVVKLTGQCYAGQLKALDPALTVIFGGYALMGPPGRTVARSFPWVDHIVLGDGEQAIVDLARLVLGVRGGTRRSAGHRVQDRPGLQIPMAATRLIRALSYELNNSPVPDYDDWFADLAVLDASHGIRVETHVLPVESSRGCWWGQSKHCVFCGIDDDTLRYRYRDPDLTLAMLDDLRARYGNLTFRFADYIMPKRYYSELLPKLAERRPLFRLHAEIKANHPPERVRLLRDAGFVAVQPGVESFATPVLRSMDKGVRGIDNVCLIKTAYLEHLTIYYNVLYGLPDDASDVYESMLASIPRIYHLSPPVSRTETIVTRFAPLQADPARFGLSSEAVHHRCYDVLFSDQFVEANSFSLDDYAYYFERNFAYSNELALLYSQLVLQIDHLEEAAPNPVRGAVLRAAWRQAGDQGLSVLGL